MRQRNTEKCEDRILSTLSCRSVENQNNCQSRDKCQIEKKKENIVNKKILGKKKKSHSQKMAEKLAGTKDSKDAHHITDKERNIISQLDTITIKKTISEMMDSRMEQWLNSKRYLKSQELLVNMLASKRSTLIESAARRQTLK